MNYNENIMLNDRGRNQGLANQAILVQCNNKKKITKNESKSITTPSSHSIKWKNLQNSFLNSAVRTGSSSRTHTTSLSDNECRVILALSEGRGEAACEVGIAAINLSQPTLTLCQISDSQSYINTLTKINILNPTEIIIPLTFVGAYKANRLVEKVKQYFPDINITAIARSAFNKSNGIHVVSNLCIPAMNSVLLILQNRYYALAAASGLMAYIDNVLNLIYANHSLKVEYQESENSTIIDITTADKLELVACAKQTISKHNSNLYSIMNFCLTKIGSRTLRASILQPPSDVKEIESRLNCVTELIDITNSEASQTLRSILGKIPNIDQLLNVVTLIPKVPQEGSERQLNYLLLLNSFLEILEPLTECLGKFKNSYFKQVTTNLERGELQEIKALIKAVIADDAKPAKGSNGILQRCFAIKPGINALLDLIRKSYSERLDEIREYVKNLGEKYNLPLSLSNNNTKGYHISLPLTRYQKRTFKKSDIPSEFIQVDRLSGSFTMKTTDLINYSVRIEEIMSNILKLSNVMIHRIIVKIKDHISLFYTLCEDISKLDMLQSLAKLSGVPNYVRPKFANYLEIEHGRHPILDFICSETPVSNSLVITPDNNLHIISGPNGSGKSIFIRQIVLTQVMAQVGCYVPAEAATLRIADRILARISLDDNSEIGISAFTLEILEVVYFLQAMSRNTLIVIDELCRSTSVEEGTALAMAICQKLAQTPAFILFTTHFKSMAILGDMYLNIKIWQMETLVEDKNGNTTLNFMYKLVEGMTSLENYGLIIANRCWTKDALEYATKVLHNTKRAKDPYIEDKNVFVFLRLKYDFETELQLLKKKKQLTPDVLKAKLENYQKKLSVYEISSSGNNFKDSSSSNTNILVQYTGQTSFENSNNEIQNDYFSKSLERNAEKSFSYWGPHNNDVVASKKLVSFNKNDKQNQYSENLDENDVTFDWVESSDKENDQKPVDYLGLYTNNDPMVNYTHSILNSENFRSNKIQNYTNDTFLKPTNLSNESYKSNLIETRTSEFTTKNYENRNDHGQNQFNTSSDSQFKHPENPQMKNSFISINEAQFSFPLNENRHKTSTPIPHTGSYQYSNGQNSFNFNINFEKNKFTPISDKNHGQPHNHYSYRTENFPPQTNDSFAIEDETKFIQNELDSYSEYFSEISLDEIEKKEEKQKNNIHLPKIIINKNDSVKLNSQEMESVIMDLTCVSEHLSQNDWSENEEKPYSVPERNSSSISYSPDISVLKEITGKEEKNTPETIVKTDTSISENTCMKIEPKRRKIKVPFKTDYKPFVKVKRQLLKRKLHKKQQAQRMKENGSETNSSDKNLEHNDKDENMREKNVIILQNILLKTSDETSNIVEVENQIEQEQRINENELISDKLEKKDPIRNNIQCFEEKENEIVKESVSYTENNAFPSSINSKFDKSETGLKNDINFDTNNLDTSDDFVKKTVIKKQLGMRKKKLRKITHSNTNLVDTPTDLSFKEKPSEKISEINNISPQNQELSKTVSINRNNSFKENEKPKSTPKNIKPYHKLTRKEIKEDFEKQDEVLLDANCPIEYAQQILNRPSIKSAQNVEVVATIKKTEKGVVVLSPPAKKIKKRNKFLPPFKFTTNQSFDVTLFSDKNSDKFNKIINKADKGFSYDSSFEVNTQKRREDISLKSKEQSIDLSEKPFEFFGIKFERKCTVTKPFENFKEQISSTFSLDNQPTSQNFKTFGLTNSNLNKDVNMKPHFFQQSNSNSFSEIETVASLENGKFQLKFKNTTPDLGEGESDIDSIVSKYLKNNLS